MPAKPLTPEQKAEAETLKQLFGRWKSEHGKKQDDALDVLGFGQSALSQYLNGKIPLNPGTAVKFAQLLVCEVDEFSPSMAAQIRHLASGTVVAQAGEHPSLRGMDDRSRAIFAEPPVQLAASDLVIRQFETGGSMGKGVVLAEQPGVIKEWRVSEQWAQQNIHRVTSLKNLAIVTGFGPSMQPLFNPGDPLLVDCGVTRADVDGIYFFRVGDEGFVKQLQRIPTTTGLVLRAKSYNTLYDPFDITAGMDFEVFARVVKVWRGEEF